MHTVQQTLPQEKTGDTCTVLIQPSMTLHEFECFQGLCIANARSTMARAPSLL